MSDQQQRSIDWNLVLTLVGMVIVGVIAFVVVREKQSNIIDDITELRAKDREHGDAITKIREDRSIETKINDLTLEVRLLRQEVEQGNKDNKRRQ